MEEGLQESGKSVEEAVAKALERLGLDRSQVEVEVVSEGRTGLFGLGAEDARVYVRPTGGAPPDVTELGDEAELEIGALAAHDDLPAVEDADEAIVTARGVLSELLSFMGFEADVTTRRPETPGDGSGHVSAILDVTGVDLGLLIGRRGSTLAALQYMVNLIVNSQMKGQTLLVGVDIEGYKRRREDALRNLALRLAERVRSSRQTITMEPMPPNERRIVHMALADEPNIATVSIGQGEDRKVVISYTR
jgi:spoIIIJ-associated protein